MNKAIHRNHLPVMAQAMGLSGTVVEVGVAEGHYSKVLIALWPFEVVMVDRWCHVDGYDDVMNGPDSEHEDRFRQAQAVASSANGRARILRMDSAEAAGQFADRSLPFVYLDGDHSYDGVARDIRAWAKKIQVGGILAGHDYYNKPPFEVRRAVSELCGGPCGITLESCPSWWVVVG